jgi:HlyD family secretion protein
VLLALIIIGFLPRPIPVETTRVAKGALRVTVNEEGKTRIEHRYLMSAPVAGHLRRIPFKAGADVEAGKTIVAIIDPAPSAMLDPRARALAEANRDTAAANLEKAREQEGFSAKELKRAERLFEDKTVSPQELENAQWRETSAAKQLSAAESALRQAEAELTEFPLSGDLTNAVQHPLEIKSPINGKILRVLEESARVVSVGTPLLELGDPAQLEAVIEVLSRDGAAIFPGAKVELDQWGGGPPIQGSVRLVEPAAFLKVSALGVEEQRVNVIIDLVTPPDQRRSLGDAFRVEGRIVVWEAEDVLKVPAGALFRRGQDWAAYVLANGRAELRRVRTGRTNGIETQILEGLNEGEEVILYPGDRVRRGGRAKQVHVGNS